MYPSSNNQPFNNQPPFQPTQPGHPGAFYPPQQPPPPFQPSMPPQPTRKKRKIPVWGWIVIVLVVLAMCGAISNASRGSTDTTATTTDSSTVQATTAPTQLPTATPKPKQTATISVRDQIDQQVTSDAQVAMFGTNTNSNYFPDDKSVVVTETLKEQFDNSGYLTEIKSDCFDIQNKVWHDTSLHLSTVEIHMIESLIDTSNGQSVTKMVAFCTLKAGTEAQFDWSNMNADSAWTAPAYDQIYLDPSLSQ